MSVSEFAAARGISKQAVSKRLKAFGGRVATHRQGQAVLLKVTDYDRLAASETDPAQALRNIAQTAQRPEALPLTAPPLAAAPGGDLALKVYSQQRARREGYDAELSKLKIERESGRWIEAGKAAQAWGKELAAFVAETESYIVNRLVRDIAERHGLDWKAEAVLARDGFRSFRAREATRAQETEKELTHGVAG